MTWKYEVAPGGIDFVSGTELGKDYKGDLFVGSARGSLRGGNLFRLPISNNRKEVDPDDRRLKDSVADNVAKYEITESESLLFGENFGVTPDLKESPDGLAVRRLLHAGHGVRDQAQVGVRRAAGDVCLRPRVGFWG